MRHLTPGFKLVLAAAAAVVALLIAFSVPTGGPGDLPGDDRAHEDPRPFSDGDEPAAIPPPPPAEDPKSQPIPEPEQQQQQQQQQQQPPEVVPQDPVPQDPIPPPPPLPPVTRPTFVDVSKAAGISELEADKTSSPSLGDLDQNGYIDIVMSNHAREDLEIYMGSASGFNRTTFFLEKQDRHGTACGDFDGDGLVDILLTIGGTNGLVPAVPVIGKSLPDGGFKRFEAEDVGLAERTMRGVGGRFVDIDSDGDLDLFILSRPPLAGGPVHSVYENLGNGQFKFHPATGIEFGKTIGFLVTDYDQDGHPDILLTGQGVEMWKGDGRFGFTDVTSQVLPAGDFHVKYSGLAELDFDNDGDFDLYLGAGARGKKEFDPANDVLFENVGGKFIDSSGAAHLPVGGSHIGITVGDFNNDGHVDVFLPREGPQEDRIPDLLLLNNGDKTFTTIENHGANGPVDQSHASGGQAFDFNRDGLIDVVVGARRNPDAGRLRLFENTTPNPGNYLVVDLPVKNELGHSSMDALVKITAGDKVLVRKAGSVGEFRTQSYIDSVHFGLGDIAHVDRIDVTLSTGKTYASDQVDGVNREIRVGDPALHLPPAAGTNQQPTDPLDLEDLEDLPADLTGAKAPEVDSDDFEDLPENLASGSARITFEDVSERTGISNLEADKTSSPSIGDLDQNGYFDIVMSNHAREDLEIYMGSASGFNRTTFFLEKQDRHGTACADFDGDGLVDILLTIGGTNGLVPAVPVVGRSLPGGGFERLEAEDVKLDARKMRGVGGRFVDIDSDGDLDLFILSRPPLAGGPIHSVYENTGNGTFKFHESTGIEFGKTIGFLVTDYNKDGHPDILLSGQGVQMWKGDGQFGFTEVTNEVFPKSYPVKFSGLAELDYDNDGDFDLYLAAGARGKKDYDPADDVLLENVGDKFVDVSQTSKLPVGGCHIGITVADFNNDGHMDVFIPREGPSDDRVQDLLLVNKGDKTFEVVESHGANGPVDQSHASGGQAFDYNRDGRIDVVVGARRNPDAGRLRLFENTSPVVGNYLVVDLPVKNEYGHSSMDALVTITAGGSTFTRKAGSVGEFRTQSYIDSVHFGLGEISSVDRIDVILSTGQTYSKESVESVNTEVRVGDASLHLS